MQHPALLILAYLVVSALLAAALYRLLGGRGKLARYHQHRLLIWSALLSLAATSTAIWFIALRSGGLLTWSLVFVVTAIFLFLFSLLREALYRDQAEWSWRDSPPNSKR